MTVYNPDPLKVAEDFKKSGAEYLHLVDLELSQIYLILVFLYLPVAFRDQFLSVGDLLADKVQVGKHTAALRRILRELPVDDFDLTFKSCLLFFIGPGVLGRKAMSGKHQEQCYEYGSDLK